jgi:hypothetical protein
MTLYFDNSRLDRQRRARRLSGETRTLDRSPIPPAKTYKLMNYAELLYPDTHTHQFVFDTEAYPNYSLAAFKCIHCKQIVYFEDSPDAAIDTELLNFILHRYLVVGFNSQPYDLPILRLMIDGGKAEQLKELSNKLILENERPRYDMRLARINHIDLIDVAPITASLKTYGGRLHCERMQDLPYHHMKQLTKEEAANVRDYCINDLDITELLYFELLPHIQLREILGSEYGLDLRSKSDSQIAEAIVLSELKKLGPIGKHKDWDFGTVVKYKIPDNVSFQTPQLQRMLQLVKDAEFKINAAGHTNTPKELGDLNITIGNSVYRMGNGGLHSSEKSISHYADKDTLIIDRDVASYYPRILINQKLFPEHIGPNFLFIYEERIVARRLKAKADGNKTEADGLKIAANGTFGKLGEPYSQLYSPDLVTQITVSGQLYLFMLIERIELAGFHVVSANTDGIVIKCPIDYYDTLCNVISMWEEESGFVTEETRYRSLHCRDVNNYIAVKEDGTTKTKGVYCERGSALNSVLSKNPETLILSDAIQLFVSNEIPIERTIKECNDIRRFVAVRSVKGGAEKDGVFLGKSIRWYYSNIEKGEISYVLSGNKVPKTVGAKPLMILPSEIPDDLDYEYYINEANNILYDIGVYKKSAQGKLL